MISRLKTPAVRLMLAFLFVSIVFIACNNESSDSKEAKPDETVTPAPDNKPAMESKDTIKIDTADTRPVRTTD
ncbi:MAG: hypothetical protein GC171_16215 [Terrimonas sp.]|nr:hypothetical protein [Terrimonas sp.]